MKQEDWDYTSLASGQSDYVFSLIFTINAFNTLTSFRTITKATCGFSELSIMDVFCVCFVSSLNVLKSGHVSTEQEQNDTKEYLNRRSCLRRFSSMKLQIVPDTSINST